MVKNALYEDMMRHGGIEGSFWIGLNDIRREGKLKWSDKTKPTFYGDWYSGKSNNEQRDCVYLRSEEGSDVQWAFNRCIIRMFFICEIPADVFVSDTLKEATVDILDQYFCRSSYSEYLTESMVCAAQPGNGACFGDIGGPMMCQMDD
ncbi:collectin-11-like [Saccoglossus kowalevskii]